MSIGNLLISEEAVLRTAFDPKYRDEGTGSNLDWEAEYHRLELQGGLSTEGFQKQRKDMEDIINALVTTDKCHGFIIDGDMANNSDKCFDMLLHAGQRSGTSEFMSNALLQAIDMNDEYFQSPIDDIESFYFVAQWAAAYHPTNTTYPRLDDLRNKLAGDLSKRWMGTDAHVHCDGKLKEEDYGPFQLTCRTVLKAWYPKLAPLRTKWVEDVKEKADDIPPGSQEERIYYIRNFICVARQGVIDFGDVVLEHLTQLTPTAAT